MPNLDPDSPVLASARWHMKCPLCREAEGVIMLKERFTPNSLGHDYASQTEITCKTCGLLGRSGYVFDFVCPSGTTEIEHGKAAAIIFSMWLKDHPPDAVTQLAVIGRRSPELQSGGDDDPGTPCPACGCTAKHRSTGLDAEADQPLA